MDYQLKNISSPDVTNLLLEDLIIWTNYEIEVAAYNGAGLGAFSHKVTEWTLQGGERPSVHLRFCACSSKFIKNADASEASGHYWLMLASHFRTNAD